jgi:NAD(P)-dependent dehydrogenase (short-subunit alcohol dehydrogenase family)
MALERLRLDGRVAIVTGAGRGLGRGIARVLAEAGAAVVGTARTADGLAETVRQIEGAGGTALALTGDVTSRIDNERVVAEAVQRFGRIDILVNNAGGATARPFLDISDAYFRDILEWNLGSAFMMSQLAVPHMLEAGEGAIVNISSAAARIGSRGMVSYGVAKAGLEHLTRVLAQELSPRIRVNAVSLGTIATEGLRAALAGRNSQVAGAPGAPLDEVLREGTPLRRMGDVEDIGLAVLYLCSHGCYATGSVFHIDGGIQQSPIPRGIADL